MDTTSLPETVPAVMSREEARAAGLKHFYTGVPCKNGHLAPRYVATTQCSTCAKIHQQRRNETAPRCSVDGCDDPVRARGFCANHNLQFVKYGDPLVRVHNKAGAMLSWIDAHKGYSGTECLIWPFPRCAKYGYGILVHTPEGNKAPHVLMCVAAHGPKPNNKSVAAHSCNNGAGGCVSPVHLRWATYKENAADKLVHGTQFYGSQHHSSVLKEHQVLEILSMKGTMSQEKIAAIFGVSRSAIKMIFSGHNWKHLQ